MGLRQWLEHQRDRVLTLSAARRGNDPVARIIRSGDSAGIAEVFLQQAETEGLLRDFRERERRLLIEHQGALARALGRDLLENPHSHQSDDWRAWQDGWQQENDNLSHTRRLMPAKSRQRSNSMER
jgi:hypothetical protein